MNKYVKEYLRRGIIFSGLGPIVFGIVIAIVGAVTPDFSIAGWQILLGIVSTFIIAFVQAGSTIFNQIDSWSPVKGCLLQLASLYVVYVGSYLVNSWIPFDWIVIVIFTVIFVATFFLIWLIVFIVNKAITKNMNKHLIK